MNATYFIVGLKVAEDAGLDPTRAAFYGALAGATSNPIGIVLAQKLASDEAARNAPPREIKPGPGRGESSSDTLPPPSVQLASPPASANPTPIL